MIKKTFLTVLVMSFVGCFFNSCQVNKAEKNLDPESSEFMSQVRYIITPGEYDQFINLPAQEREKFIENFWKRRDPDPETEENEFKEFYFARLAESREFFSRGAGGYLTDRGMIYVLFGPPDYVYHSKASMYDQAGGVREQWYYYLLLDKYYNVEINFIDRMGTSGFSGPHGFSSGTFELDRGGFSIFPLIQEAKERFLAPGRQFKHSKYTIRIKKLDKEDAGEGVKLSIQIEVPYKDIWFSKAEDKMKATFSVSAEILDDSKNKIWEHEQDYSLTVTEKEVQELLKVKKDYVIEIPAKLEKGKYSLQISITDSNEEEEKRVLPLKI
jgi:GWxTD domain-containing protein